MPCSNHKMLTKLLNIPGVQVVGNTEVHSQELILTIEADKKEAICPRCHHKSNHIKIILI